jgi:hypothetical protein
MSEQIDEWTADGNEQLVTFREEWPESAQQEPESV